MSDSIGRGQTPQRWPPLAKDGSRWRHLAADGDAKGLLGGPRMKRLSGRITTATATARCCCHRPPRRRNDALLHRPRPGWWEGHHATGS